MKINQLRIGVLHYHLLRSGVRTVIANSLRGLIAHSSCPHLEIDLISRDARSTVGDELAGELQAWSQKQVNKQAQEPTPTQVSIRQIEIPELDYNQTPAVSREKLFQSAEQLSQRLLDALEPQNSNHQNPYILHVHNANLGKNPRLTLALKLLADRLEKQNLPAWILYQMHDFAEDNRPACWSALRDCSGQSNAQLAVEMMYPNNNRVLWVCINSPDRKRLLAAGLDPEMVEVLPNSVDEEIFSAPALADISPEQLRELELESRDFAADLKNRIADFARENGFRFEADRKILLAPIKPLRRKNVIESVLLLMSLNRQDDSYQLLITLLPNSEADIAYCRTLEEFVKRHQLPVVIGLGQEILRGGHHRIIENGRVLAYSLIDLMHLSDAVVTTSIQEGFGYVFHEPWLAGKAVLGRNIPSVTDDFKAQGMQLDHLYDYLLFPKAWLAEQGENLGQAYRKKIESLYRAADLPLPSGEKLPDRINREKTYKLYNRNLIAEETLDWADLSAELQILLLQRFTEHPHLLDMLVWADHNLEPFSFWYSSECSAIINQNQEMIASVYGLESVTGQMQKIISRGNRLAKGPKLNRRPKEISNEAIFESLLDVKNIRLLA